MLYLLPLLMMQSTGTIAVQQEFDQYLAQSDVLTDQIIDCMEAEYRNSLRRHRSDATAELVIQEALTACSHFRDDLQRMADETSPEIMGSRQASLSDALFESLRTTFLEVVDNFLIQPSLAENRRNMVRYEWQRCVVEKATDWSRLNESAEVVAQASLTACDSHRENFRLAAIYWLRSQSIPVQRVTEILEPIGETMRSVAIEKIVSERASRLP